MNIFTPEYRPSSGFSTPELIAFPTDLSFYWSDYQAVMQEKNYLRIWSQSTWPEDDFTAQQNSEDLALHVEDNQTHRAYGYMLYTPDKKFCLGSVYFNSLASLNKWYDINETDHTNLLNKFAARIDYWCVQGMDKKITMALHEWVKSEWQINVLWASRDQLTERTKTFSALASCLEARLKSKETNSFLELYSLR